MSGSPFDMLGVAPGAGEREIKQAYARLLRQHRPDEDPDGFQRANEAYQAALALCAGTATAAPPAGTRDTVATPPSRPADPVRPPAAAPSPSRVLDDDGFDFADFFGRLQRYAAGRGPEAVEDWLRAQDALLRIGRTERVGDQLCAVFASGDPQGFSSEHVNAIEEFFNIDTELDLHPNVRALWAVQDERIGAYGQTLALPIQQLKRRFTRWQAVLVSCMPAMAWRIDTLGDELVRDYGGLPPGVDPEQRAFFARQNDPGYLGLYRWLPILFNSALPALLMFVLGMIAGTPERVLQVAAWFFTAFATALTLSALFGWFRVRRMRRWVRRRGER